MTGAALGLSAAVNAQARRIVGVLDIDADGREVKRARAWISETMRLPWRIAQDVLENVKLCASEVITNAIVHGACGQSGNRITVILIYAPSVIRVEVIDPGEKPDHVPHVRDIEPESDIGGRGLEIVAILAQRWNYYTDAAGRTVWFEMEC